MNYTDGSQTCETPTLVIKLCDTMVAHEPNFIQNTDTITFVRGDIHPDDIVIYSDSSLEKRHPSAKTNIAWLFESPELHRRYYNYIEKHNNLFDLVLTFDKELLDRGENFRFNVYGTTWLHETYRNIWEKSKMCSFILSHKQSSSGHKLRHVIANLITRDASLDHIDIYGGNYKSLPFSETKAFAADHSPQHISNQKILALKDYRFSIVIENCKEDYYFTEKIIDCFLSGVVPIYYGCPSIGDFFNTRGMLMFDTQDECLDILQTLSSDTYNTMLPYIKENYETAQKYATFKFNEEEIMKTINKI